jgi:hypothetical protein
LVRVDGGVLGSSPGKSGFKAYRLYPVGTGLTPKKGYKAGLPPPPKKKERKKKYLNQNMKYLSI